MSKSIIKKSLVAVMILLSLTFIILFWNYYSDEGLHQKIDIGTVESIDYWGSGIELKKATEQEKIKIIGWFNNVSDIRPNTEFAGITPESGIIINLIGDKRIIVINSGTDFEIQRTDMKSKNIAYWGKHREINDFLDSLEIKR